MRLLKILTAGLAPEDACLYKGKGRVGEVVKKVNPTTPSEEAVAESIGDDEKKKRVRSKKNQLKMPVKTVKKTGLKT